MHNLLHASGENAPKRRDSNKFPSEPQIDVCLAQLPKGEKNPLSARARSSQVEKRTVKIGVGLLPYVWIGSVWQKRRPVPKELKL